MSTLRTYSLVDSTTREHQSPQVVIIGAGAGGAFAAMTLAEAGIEWLSWSVATITPTAPYLEDLAGAVANLYAEGGFAQPMAHLLFPSQRAKAWVAQHWSIQPFASAPQRLPGH